MGITIINECKLPYKPNPLGMNSIQCIVCVDCVPVRANLGPVVVDRGEVHLLSYT